MLGYDSAEELLAIGNTRALYADASLREELRAEYLRNGRVESTVEWKRKDGKAITVRINGRRAQDPLHGSECVEVMVQDVTERMALEKQLARSAKVRGHRPACRGHRARFQQHDRRDHGLGGHWLR